MRPQLLRAFGWQIVHVLSADWFRERKAVVDRLVATIENGPQLPPAEAQDDNDDDCWDEPNAPVAEAEQPPPEAMPLIPGSTGTPAGTGKRYFEFVGGASSERSSARGTSRGTPRTARCRACGGHTGDPRGYQEILRHYFARATIGKLTRSGK
jgi:hypothetical protein